MFALYSKGCEYILRALVCVLNDSSRKSFRAEDVCREAGVSESFTRKSFQALAKKGILITVRGPGGGYQLAAAPGDISVLDIIKAVEGEETFDRCSMGLERCGDEAPCPIHEVWKRLKKTLLAELRQTTILQLMHATTKKKKAAASVNRLIKNPVVKT